MKAKFLFFLIAAVAMLSRGFVPEVLGQSKPLITNKYILTLDPSKTKIIPTKVVDTLVWLGNGYGLIRVVYKQGGYNPRAAKTHELNKEFNFSKDAEGNNMAWGIIDTTGKFLLEPIYKSIDLWADMRGLAYEVKYYRNEPDWGYVTYVDLVKGKARYLKGFDHGLRITKDFIFLFADDKNDNSVIVNTSLDTLVITDRIAPVYYGTSGSMKEYDGWEFNSPKTLENLKIIPNPEYFLILQGILSENKNIVYNAELTKILPNSEYTFISSRNGYLVATNSNDKRLVLGNDLKPVTAEYKEIDFSRDNNCWVMNVGECKYELFNPDFTEMDPIRKADLSKKYFDDCLALKIKREKAEKKAALGYDNPDLAEFLLGSVKYLKLRTRGQTYELNEWDNHLGISRLNNSETEVNIFIRLKTTDPEYLYTEKISETTNTLKGEFKVKLRLDPNNSYIILIGDDNFGGTFNKVTKELYLHGTDSEGKLVELGAILE